jgi:hypothetical protein
MTVGVKLAVWRRRRAKVCARGRERTQETDTNSLRDLEEFPTVGCIPIVSAASRNEIMGESLTLLRLADELDALPEELARHVEDLLQLVGHYEDGCGDCVRWQCVRATRAIGAERQGLMALGMVVRKGCWVEWVRRVVVRNTCHNAS